jgi:hypothetical protein
MGDEKRQGFSTLLDARRPALLPEPTTEGAPVPPKGSRAAMKVVTDPYPVPPPWPDEYMATHRHYLCDRHGEPYPVPPGASCVGCQTEAATKLRADVDGLLRDGAANLTRLRDINDRLGSFARVVDPMRRAPKPLRERLRGVVRHLLISALDMIGD